MNAYKVTRTNQIVRCNIKRFLNNRSFQSTTFAHYSLYGQYSAKYYYNDIGCQHNLPFDVFQLLIRS
jgi:hypothetical protein